MQLMMFVMFPVHVMNDAYTFQQNFYPWECIQFLLNGGTRFRSAHGKTRTPVRRYSIKKLDAL